MPSSYVVTTTTFMFAFTVTSQKGRQTSSPDERGHRATHRSISMLHMPCVMGLHIRLLQFTTPRRTFYPMFLSIRNSLALSYHISYPQLKALPIYFIKRISKIYFTSTYLFYQTDLEIFLFPHTFGIYFVSKLKEFYARSTLIFSIWFQSAFSDTFVV